MKRLLIFALVLIGSRSALAAEPEPTPGAVPAEEDEPAASPEPDTDPLVEEMKPDRPAEPQDRQAQIDAAVEAEQWGTAVILCEEARDKDELTLALRTSCGKAYVGLGDKLLAAGSPKNAHKRWEDAVAIDPRLIDDPDFVRRLESTRTKAQPSTGTGGRPEPKEPRPKPLPDKPLPVPEERTGPPPDAGPRWNRDLELGLSFGYDGFIAVTIGWLSDETILGEVSFGIVYPTADMRVRWLGMKNCLTPYVGIGMLVPFGEEDRLGFDVPGYSSLYELGEIFHLDIGLAYTPFHSLDLTLGVAFVTPFDQEHPDTVLFFPQVSGGVSWFF